MRFPLLRFGTTPLSSSRVVARIRADLVYLAFAPASVYRGFLRRGTPEAMPRNTLVINCDIRETRVALIEEGIIAELQIERAAARGTVGNIVLGRVTRVLPGMQAAG